MLKAVRNVACGVALLFCCPLTTQSVGIGEDVTLRVLSSYNTEMWRNDTLLYTGGGGAGGGRGFNAVALDGVTGDFLEGRNFDTWGSGEVAADEFLTFLDTWPFGTVLLLSTADDAGLNISQGCTFRNVAYVDRILTALASLGSSHIQEFCWRSSWAMIVTKGHAVHSEEIARARSPVTATANLRFSVFDTKVEHVGHFSANHAWVQVAFDPSPSRPVVLLGPPSINGGDPAVARLQDISLGVFQARIQEFDYLVRVGRDSHVFESVPYAVLEQGRQTRSDGSVWEVFTHEAGGEWTWVGFSQPFAKPPYVFGTVQTYSYPEAVAVRIRNVTRTGFEVSLVEEEALGKANHGLETIGFLALNDVPDSKKLFFGNDHLSYLVDRETLTHQFKAAIGAEVRLQEEQSFDPEVNHVSEEVNFLALGPALFVQVVSFNGGDPITVRRRVSYK